MKRIIFVFYLFWVAACLVQAQELKAQEPELKAGLTLSKLGLNRPTYIWNSMTTALFNRYDSLGITYNAALKLEYDTYIFKPWSDSALGDSAEGFWLLNTDSILTLTDSTRVKQNLIHNGYTLVSVDSLVWQLGLGVRGRATEGYLNTTFSPANDSSHWKRLDAGLGFYSRTDVNQASYDMGVVAGICGALCSRYSGSAYTKINEGIGTSTSIVTANSLGLFFATRTDSIRIFQNGSVLKTGALTTTTGIVSDSLFICGTNNGSNALSNGSTRQYSCVLITKGVSPVWVRKFNNILEAYFDYKKMGVE